MPDEPMNDPDGFYSSFDPSDTPKGWDKSTPVKPYRDNRAELEAAARADAMSRSWLPFLFGTFPLFLVAGALLATPFVLAYYMLAPKINAAYANVPQAAGITPDWSLMLAGAMVGGVVLLIVSVVRRIRG